MSPIERFLGCALLSGAALASAQVRVDGETKVWHTLTLNFRGPESEETASAPNPFLDYRLQVHFRAPSGREYNVPGFFDGDGAGGGRGGVWRARFTPDEPGAWRYRASFRTGAGVAVETDPEAGKPAAFDGASGTVRIAPRDPKAQGFARWGRLEYAGGHYLKFRDGGYWIRGGTDSPENFLAYAGFNNTPPSHRFADHVADWRPGDPDWGGGKGKAIIGALNYLAARHVNSIYFLAMNIGGDGKDVWPWAGTPDPKGNPANDNLHFDTGKLAQWETVFAHAGRRGLFLHFVLNEAEEENKRELDNGELGTERKLYYRELIARFSHHLALQWNLCEEYNLRFNFGPERIRAFAGYIREVDPYRHPVTVHPVGDPLGALRFTFGDERFSMTSIQLGWRRIDTLVEEFRRETAAAGRPLPVSMDEFTVEKGQKSPAQPVNDPEAHRKQKLWPVLLSGGMIEFILEDLLGTDSFKTPPLEALWNYTWYARRFLEQELPFQEMSPNDELVTGESTLRVSLGKGQFFDLGAQVLAKPGHVWAVYLPVAASAGEIDLGGAGRRFALRWYNPRTGLFEGAARTVQGGRRVPLGAPPSAPSEDWVVLVKAP
jgi:hypothetical protein